VKYNSQQRQVMTTSVEFRPGVGSGLLRWWRQIPITWTIADCIFFIRQRLTSGDILYSHGRTISDCTILLQINDTNLNPTDVVSDILDALYGDMPVIYSTIIDYTFVWPDEQKCPG
jgi:hypothetical protein